MTARMKTWQPLSLLSVAVIVTLTFSAIVQGSDEDYHIDVLVYVDYAFYDNWLKETKQTDSPAARTNVKQYIAYVFQGVDRRYRSINSLPFNISVHVSKIDIATNPGQSPWTETVKQDTGGGRSQVNATLALDNLQQFVKSNFSNPPPFDHFMLLTRYDLMGNFEEGQFTAGLAYVGTMCGNASVSIVEDDGAAITEATAAHELGHSLGALHDGQDNTCDSNDLFAMTAVGANPNVTENEAHRKVNLWTFSPCSLSYFNELALKLSNAERQRCLLTQVTPEDVPPVPDDLPRHPDQQCRHIFNEDSYLCRQPYSTSGVGDVCLKMACYNPGLAGDQCTVHTADAGTCCGQGKWCQQGRCVDNLSNDKCASISESCPFGNQPANIKFSDGSSVSCDSLHKAYCYDPRARAKCCERCEQFRSNDSDCEYGDRVLCQDPSQPTARRACYNATYNELCCGSFGEAKSDDPDCPYGDRVGNCAELSSTCNTQQRQSCCQTCKKFDLPTTTALPTTTTSRTTTMMTETTTASTPTTTTTTLPTTTTTTTTLPTTTTTSKTTTAVPTTTTMKTTPREPLTSKPISTTPTTTTMTPTSATTIMTSKSTTITTRPSPTTPTAVNAAREKCKPLLGITTCGCADLTTNLMLLMTSLVASAALILG